MWIIRFILLAVLVAFEGIASYLHRYSNRYEKLFKSKIFNTVLVIVYNFLCYLIMILPPARGYNARPDWLEYQTVGIGFPVIGLLLICSGALLGFATLRQRKAIGIQDVKEGLLTSGFYRYFRHPINTGILWISFGLLLITRNPDGLLIFPAFFVIFLVGTILEERRGICARFREQYQAYRKTTKMFGPIWLWSILVVLLLALVYIGSVYAD